MSRIKKEILNKLKEYAGKMGKDHLGGDDYTSKKRGGLRDFDGYDNVDFNKDMPMDEATRGTIHKAAKKGSYPVSLVVVKNGKVIKQVLNIKTPQEVPAVFNVVKNYHKHKDATVHIEDRTGKRLFSEACWKGYKSVGGKIKNGKQVPNCVPESVNEDSPESAHPQGSKKITNRTTVMDMLDVISHKEFGPDYHKLSTKQKKEVHKLAIKGKLIKQSPFKESVNEAIKPSQVRSAISKVKKQLMRKWKQKGGYENFGQKELDKMKSKFKDNPYGSSDERQISKMLDGFDNWAMNYDGNMRESVNEGYSKHFTYDEVVKSIVDFAKSKGYKIPSKGLDIIKGNPPSGPKRGWSRGTSIPLDKKINLSFDIYGVGKVFTVNQRLKLNKTFAESVIDETTLFGDFLLEGGLPQNWMAGRVSDYHTKLRGKRKDYDDTNFAKMNTGQPDIEDEELDSDNEVVNEKFDNTKHLSLLNKALRAIPGSKKQKDIIKQLNVVRKLGGMKPLKETAIEEYGQRLDLSYILDDESVLDGTPEEKDAINRESAKKKTEKNYKDWKSTNESLNSDISNAKKRLKDPHTIEDIEYSKTRRGDKFIKIIYKKKYVPGKMMDTGPHFVSIFYNDEKELQNIGKALKLKLKEGIEEETKRDYKDEYKKFQSSTKSKKYRAELNKYNRDKGTYGNGDNKDASHKGGKIVGFEAQSKNRGRAEKSRLKINKNK